MVLYNCGQDFLFITPMSIHALISANEMLTFLYCHILCAHTVPTYRVYELGDCRALCGERKQAVCILATDLFRE